VLLLRYSGIKSAVDRQVAESERWANDAGALQVEAVRLDDSLWSRMRDFIYLRETVLKISVLPARLAETAAECERLAAAHALESMWMAHAVGVLLVALEGNLDRVPAAISEMRMAAQAHGGALIVQRAPREVRRRVDVWGAPGSDFGVMLKLKHELDPRNILNPGRFVGGI
jgi:glycolate oxidase FAD binding subunit